MLSKQHRLSRKDFIQTKLRGKTLSAPHFTAVVHNQATGDRHQSRYSVVISTKIHKNATVRNRLRRQICEFLRLNPLNKKADIIIFPKAGMLNLNYEKITAELDTFISKISS